MTNLDNVKVLAKRVAILTNTDQIIYQTQCNGTKFYKFSTDWKGEAVAIVRFDRKHSSKVVLSDIEDKETKFATKKARDTTKRKLRENTKKTEDKS